MQFRNGSRLATRSLAGTSSPRSGGSREAHPCRAAAPILARFVAVALAFGVVLGSLSYASTSIAQDRELSEASDFRVRVQAALRLGRAGAAGRSDLERGLRDAHPAVRVACAVGLGNIGDAASVPVLEQAMRSEAFPTVKSAMQDTLDKLRAASAGAGRPDTAPVSMDRAKYVLQVGNMRNATGVRSGDLDAVMKQAARAKASSIQGAVVVDGSDSSVLKRASEKRIPVLLVDGNLTRLTQSAGPGGGMIVSAQVDLSIRKVPQQVLRGMVSGNASASEDSRNARAQLTELQNRAVGGAVESAMSSVNSSITALSK